MCLCVVNLRVAGMAEQWALGGPWGPPDPFTWALRSLPALRRRVPVVDVAGAHLPLAFPVLWPREYPWSLWVSPILG